MNIKITGKELKATDAIKNYVEDKLSRMEKYFDENAEVLVTIKTEKNTQISEIQVKSQGNMFKAVTETNDLYASIDKNMDILTGQIRKAKTIKEKQMKDASIKDMFVAAPEINIENEVVKTTYYDIKPMTIEDAQIKLEEQGNMFLPFINVETSKVNVIYKLKDGKNFGISEPEN